jgi:hypothetical protein
VFDYALDIEIYMTNGHAKILLGKDSKKFPKWHFMYETESFKHV